MPLHILDDKLWFPPVWESLPDGLLAAGGDLSTARLILAYRKGIFPWFEEEIPLWWSPDPRFVLFPGKLRVSHSMKQLLQKKAFRFTVNKAFEKVIDNCQKIPRKEQDGTWITSEVKKSYTDLHRQGIAWSAEAWDADGNLAGGLYGIKMGQFFFGESMFASQSNASKYAFISFVRYLTERENIQLIDCQVYTQHLESLGAEMIPRRVFLEYLDTLNP